eukprot:6210856-Pleurochrysis_carterae.AAC.3
MRDEACTFLVPVIQYKALAARYSFPKLKRILYTEPCGRIQGVGMAKDLLAIFATSGHRSTAQPVADGA